MWRSPEHMIMDLVDKPEFMHKIISRLTDANLYMLDQLEEKGLLGDRQATIHCSGAFTDELPAPGFNPKKPRAKTFGHLEWHRSFRLFLLLCTRNLKLIMPKGGLKDLDSDIMDAVSH